MQSLVVKELREYFCLLKSRQKAAFLFHLYSFRPGRLPAAPNRPTSRTKITPILPNHRVIPAFAAELALGRQDLVADGVFRCFEDAHLL